MDPKEAKPYQAAPSNDFSEFLRSLREFPGTVEKGMLQQSNDDDATNVMKAYSDIFKAQVNELCAYLEERASKASRQAHAEAVTMLKLTAANLLAQRALTISSNLASQTAKISLSGLFELIKKIVKAILEIFDITLPKWFDKLEELLDEILNFFLSAGQPRLASILSRQHQDFLAELSHLARLERESAWRYQSRDEDE